MITEPAERILVLAYGNPGRRDDGLGPAAAEMLGRLDLPDVTVQADYQLVVEDAAAIAACDGVVFVDAARRGPEPYALVHVPPARTAFFSTHSSHPGALVALAAELFGKAPPGFLLAIRGYEFDDFGEQLSARARGNLERAVQFLAGILRQTRGRTALLAHCAAPAEKEEIWQTRP